MEALKQRMDEMPDVEQVRLRVANLEEKLRSLEERVKEMEALKQRMDEMPDVEQVRLRVANLEEKLASLEERVAELPTQQKEFEKLEQAASKLEALVSVPEQREFIADIKNQVQSIQWRLASIDPSSPSALLLKGQMDRELRRLHQTLTAACAVVLDSSSEERREEVGDIYSVLRFLVP
jgi:DNA repair exonuclease SbcCD ATPase subunit